MSDIRLVNYLENSFLKPLLFRSGIGDISYNGESLYYEDSLYGRRKANLSVSQETVGDFLRQIANYSEKQFSVSSPILDVSFSRYRLNAVYSNLVRVNEEKSYSFSLRLGKPGTAIKKDSSFFQGKDLKILLKALENHESIVIAGPTSSGKTELQKFLLLELKKNTRVIVIDNVKELELARNPRIDLTSWIVDERFPESRFNALIRNALRNDPDYIVVAESRGGEMNEAISSVTSGHPIIMTLHAKELMAIPSRMARLAMMGDERLLREEVMEDIAMHFSLFVYLNKQVDQSGKISRYIESIGRMNKTSKSIEVIYQRK